MANDGNPTRTEAENHFLAECLLAFDQAQGKVSSRAVNHLKARNTLTLAQRSDQHRCCSSGDGLQERGLRRKQIGADEEKVQHRHSDLPQWRNQGKKEAFEDYLLL